MGQLATLIQYGISERATEEKVGVPMLRMNNLQADGWDLSDLKYIHLDPENLRRYQLQIGDLLFNRTNSKELVGKCEVFREPGPWVFASYLIRLRVDRNRAEPRLVAAFINSPLGRAYMLSEKRQMTGQANVNATKLKALPIALPTLPEQRDILAELDALQIEIDRLRTVQSDTAAELDALLPAILDRAFKGELV